MTSLVPISLFGWIFVVVMLFSLMSARRAVLVSFIGAVLFLPQAAITLPGLPDITKISVTSFSVLLAVALFDTARLLRFRLSWVDLPMLAWCLAPLPSSIVNGLGVYDGAAGALSEMFTWGIPYLIGRIYFNDLASLRELSIGILIGGLIYVPLCLLEIRLSPQLHRWVYGYHQHSFQQTIRFGGYRPMVFMQHGLMVGMWMTSASLIGVWMWKTGALRHLLGVPMALLVPVQLATTVLCKSTAALVLLIGGLFLLFVNRWARLSLLIACFAAIPPAYVTARVRGYWSGQQLVTLAQRIDMERAESLSTRFETETLLADKAMQRPAFGWGRWGRWRLYDEYGRDITTSDSLWIIALGETGVVGLAALPAALVLPCWLVLKRVPAGQWCLPAAAPLAALTMVVALYAMDNLLNAMLNPIYVLALGGISGYFVLSRHGAGAVEPKQLLTARLFGA